MLALPRFVPGERLGSNMAGLNRKFSSLAFV